MRKDSLTLVEVTIALMLIAMISVMGALSFNVIDSKILEKDVRKIYTDLCWIREKALATHTNYCLRFFSDNYTIYQNSCGLASNILRTENLQARIVSGSLPFDVVFYSSSDARIGGTADSTIGTNGQTSINLTYGNRTQEIKIYHSTGYIKIE